MLLGKYYVGTRTIASNPGDTIKNNIETVEVGIN